MTLQNVSWDTYVSLCDADEHRRALMTYDKGTLEIMSPGRRHEEAAHIIGRMIETWTEVAGIEIAGTRSMTCRRESEQRGFEGDNSYYVTHEREMRGIREFDSEVHPPPDLVVEIDISTSSMNKLAVYESMRVPEVWLFDGHTVRAFAADQKGKLSQVPSSRELPGFPFDQVVPVINAAVADGENTAIRAFRKRASTDLNRDA
ncbi:MAG: Uma2 family endonuclease [Planctomycetaceae bacterium]